MKEFGILMFLALIFSLPNLSAQSLHQPLQDLLTSYVSTAGVNYAKLKSKEVELDTYLNALSGAVPSEDDRSNDAKAFWMNAYNAFTLKMVTENYPITTVKELYGGNPWDEKWITLGEQKYTLNQIEKEILIKGFGDARVHFGINCAAKSCPPLSGTAFTKENVEAELEHLTIAFVKDQEFNQVTSGGSKVSKIFEWYGSDFEDVTKFLTKYTGVEGPGALSFTNYDWTLNESAASGS